MIIQQPELFYIRAAAVAERMYANQTEVEKIVAQVYKMALQQDVGSYLALDMGELQDLSEKIVDAVVAAHHSY